MASTDCTKAIWPFRSWFGRAIPQIGSFRFHIPPAPPGRKSGCCSPSCHAGERVTSGSRKISACASRSSSQKGGVKANGESLFSEMTRWAYQTNYAGGAELSLSLTRHSARWRVRQATQAATTAGLSWPSSTISCRRMLAARDCRLPRPDRCSRRTGPRAGLRHRQAAHPDRAGRICDHGHRSFARDAGALP